MSYIGHACWNCGVGVGGGDIGVGSGDHGRGEVSMCPLNCAVARHCVCMQKKLHLACVKSTGNCAEGSFGTLCTLENAVVACCALYSMWQKLNFSPLKLAQYHQKALLIDFHNDRTLLMLQHR